MPCRSPSLHLPNSKQAGCIGSIDLLYTWPASNDTTTSINGRFEFAKNMDGEKCRHNDGREVGQSVGQLEYFDWGLVGLSAYAE
jgi:hypothetical protein